ncbi:hypothetical protein E2562_024249 [Oryza meyeriana var. granulata]|uniref:Uncharacterized protein n=1 Tax=Oryza meyeriana var. granulata TaxID=110450 RepID=A0A6G1E242_9ORYZ|nr:hypothetical protein E2562_024249 [Oryza meyeriana var. granulata]
MVSLPAPAPAHRSKQTVYHGHHQASPHRPGLLLCRKEGGRRGGTGPQARRRRQLFAPLKELTVAMDPATSNLNSAVVDLLQRPAKRGPFVGRKRRAWWDSKLTTAATALAASWPLSRYSPPTSCRRRPGAHCGGKDRRPAPDQEEGKAAWRGYRWDAARRARGRRGGSRLGQDSHGHHVIDAVVHDAPPQGLHRRYLVTLFFR